MAEDFNYDDVTFSYELGDWFDWEIDDGEIALTRGGEIKLNGKTLNPFLIKMAAAHSAAFKDAVQMWKRKAEELTDEPMTDERALRECQEAQRILNEHIANNFVADVCVESNGCIGFSYDPERYAGIEARTSDAA